MNEEFAAAIARAIQSNLGEFMVGDTEVEVTRVFQLGKYINVDLDNGKRFKVVVEEI